MILGPLDALLSKGLELQRAGAAANALSIYRDILGSGDLPLELLLELASRFADCGDLAGSLEVFEAASRLGILGPNALAQRGLIELRLGLHGLALNSLGQAVIGNPELVEAHNNLGLVHEALNDLDQAILCYQRVLEIFPDSPEALNNLGSCRQRQGLVDDALVLYTQALSARPRFAEALANSGNCFFQKGQLTRAKDHFAAALSISPVFPECLHSLARTCQDLGDLQSAIEWFTKALICDPNRLDSRWNRAFCLLLSNRYLSGLEEYESRLDWDQSKRLMVRPPLPRWFGEPLARGSKLLVVHEQGLGDTIQFMRYIPCLVDLGIDVFLCAPTALHSLVQSIAPKVTFCTPDQALSQVHERWIPLPSLLRLFGVSPDCPRVSPPYVWPDSVQSAFWRDCLRGEVGPIIALNWQGNPVAEIENLKGRSLALESFRLLADEVDCVFLSLQKGIGSEQLDSCSFRDRFVGCQDGVDKVWDFVETLAIIENCALLITSDTALAHLAGAMGHPTWLLLQYVPDWRWGLDSEETFWYPSVRLFRQSRSGDWSGVIKRVGIALKIFLDELSLSTRDVHENPVCSSRSVPSGQALSSGVRQSGFLNRFWEWVAQSSDRSAVLSPDDLSKALDYGLAWDAPASFKRREEVAYDMFCTGLMDEAYDAYHVLSRDLGCSYRVFGGLGAICLTQGRHDEAAEWLGQAVSMCPDYVDAISNLGTVRYRQGDLAAAESCFRQALKVSPRFIDACFGLAVVMHDLGRHAIAISLYRDVVSRAPNHADACWNLSLCLLAAGDYRAGWQGYELRLLREGASKLCVRPPSSSWDGQVALRAGQSLLIVCEQGLGDSIQFFRYVSVLAASGNPVNLCAPVSLHRILQASDVRVGLLAPEHVDLLSQECWVPLLSLPSCLGVTPADPIVAPPYLCATPSSVESWRTKLQGEDGFLVALSWQGNPVAEINNLRGRSLPLEAFAPLARLDQMAFVSLQKGFGAEQLASCSFRQGFVDCQQELDSTWDFLDVAAIIACCDLVITSDSVLAHLAGAMGHPTWLLLHHVPDWRWGLEGETTFWYPSMRLFRQREPGNWDEVMQRVATALKEFMAARSS